MPRNPDRVSNTDATGCIARRWKSGPAPAELVGHVNPERIGRANAAVLPVPVWAWPTIPAGQQQRNRCGLNRGRGFPARIAQCRHQWSDKSMLKNWLSASSSAVGATRVSTDSRRRLAARAVASLGFQPAGFQPAGLRPAGLQPAELRKSGTWTILSAFDIPVDKDSGRRTVKVVPAGGTCFTLGILSG